MPYSDQEMEEIARDPTRLRAWWWHIAKHNQRLARNKRERSRRTGQQHSVINYLPRFEEGAELVRHADMSDNLANAVLDNIDALVRSSLEPARCTCHAKRQKPPPPGMVEQRRDRRCRRC
jgi:hypothetical protein